MKIFRFDKEVGEKVKKYNSDLAIYTRIIKTSEPSVLGCMYIEPNGVVGYHEAPVSQLFLVVQGEGWVTGEDRKRIFVKRGEGVFWEKGEWHESGSDKGMTAIVIQSETLNPESFMKIKATE
ncbi:cupin domain-containing protein [Thermaerobacillus caldiproteolyticus]|uniref:Quercetin dioxygenase-like cupin family protein n=1 Tax=Thermaerobacillus caldiproteolyticus TaxID=247480 RepID=A0A7V9Z7I7_9BACL|nr:cupin domain-containing protein [Anoxybacillus caldiproteolyticus]MBA2875446.1 quercetin dioxygenase-like cupin family protein [Anoxybacillus caldiproteolyticus]